MIALTTCERKMEVWDQKRAEVHIAKEEGERSFVTFRETKTGPVRSVTLIGSDFEVFKKIPLRLDTLKIYPVVKNPHQSYDFRYPFEKALKMAGIEDFS